MGMPHRQGLELLIRRLRAHSPLSADDEAAMITLPGHLRMVPARKEFVHAGERMQHVCLVLTGLIGRSVMLKDGSRQIVGLSVPGDLADLAMFMLPRASMSLCAIGSSCVMLIQHSVLNDILSRHHGIAMALWRDAMIDTSMVAQMAVNVGRRNAIGRVAHLLCEMALRFERIDAVEGATFPFPITQEQLGDILALTAVHVNRMLHTLRADGVVRVGNGRAEILDWPALAALADFEDDYLCLGECGKEGAATAAV